MRNFTSLLPVLTVLAAGCAAAQPAAEPKPCEPVNPRATAEARALLKTICSISGTFILSGQHNFPNTASRFSDHAAEVTGKYPYVWGSDFGFTRSGKDSIGARDAIMEEAKRQYAAGSIITLMWHAVRPTDNEPNVWNSSVQGKLTDAEWAELVTPGTALNQRWTAQIDNVARYLKRLQEAKVPVLWRPYHEANHGWAWWGGRPGEKGFQALYKLMYDRYVNYHHLDNLVWVWDSKTPGGPVEPYAGYYPGPRYCDILATDAYSGFAQSHHDDLAALAKGRPIALGEVGRAPTPEILKKQPLWTWFMVWTDYFDSANKPESMVELYRDPHTLSRGDPLPGKR
jgi:mannan endo-1,4-beta-mannosidase